MIFKETCFYCGMPMVNGICPDCGYQYPFTFECPYYKGINCSINNRPCRKAESYSDCNLYIKSQLKY